MTRKLPPSASVAAAAAGAKLEAPAATRNATVLCDLLLAHAPRAGNALEIASGTGQHVIAFAGAMPALVWQPTDVAEDRLASIDAYAAESALRNIRPAEALDATRPGWHKAHSDFDLVVLINLLHLISISETEVLLAEAARALGPEGKLILYGPFKRNGQLTSPGDMRFDADLRASDPAIGYKNDAEILRLLKTGGLLTTEMVEMPANNLAFIASA
ncbi:MAG: DUF938 domain-containing protein [Pseudomonadota bacterium]